MKLLKTKEITNEPVNENDFTITGLTSGKLISIYNALEKLQNIDNGLTPVQTDVFIFLSNNKEKFLDNF